MKTQRAAFIPASRPWRAAQTKVHDRPPASGEDRAHRLAREHGLEMTEVHHRRLHELRLDDRRGDLQERLVGEDRRSLGDGTDAAGEPELAQELEEGCVEAPERPQIADRVLGELEALEEVRNVLEASRDQERAMARKLPREQAERPRLVHPLAEVRGGHGDLVQVREECGIAHDEQAGREGAARTDGHRDGPLHAGCRIPGPRPMFWRRSVEFRAIVTRSCLWRRFLT
jgi:hypothetical protein